jgi:hypothetical protein
LRTRNRAEGFEKCAVWLQKELIESDGQERLWLLKKLAPLKRKQAVCTRTK